MVPWTIVPSGRGLVNGMRCSNSAPDVRWARTIFQFNCDRLVRAFHQKSGMDPSLASRFVVDNREPFKRKLVQHKQCRQKMTIVVKYVVLTSQASC